MKRLIYNSIAAALCLLLTVPAMAAKTEAQRPEHLAYAVDNNTTFELVNRYGDVNIENIKSDSLIIDVEIKVRAKNTDECNKKLAKISIVPTVAGGQIKVQTEVDGSVDDYTVNYTVKMPAYLNLNLFNKYGNVVADKLLGKSNLKVNYGTLKLNKLHDQTGGFPTIELSYSSSSTIEEIELGGINMSYSDVNVGSGKSVAVAGKYSNITVGDALSLAIEAAYGNVKIEKVAKLDLNARYTNVEVPEVSDYALIVLSYGDLRSIGLAPGCRGVDVETKYANTKIDASRLKKGDYQLDLNTQYGSINAPHSKLVIKGTSSYNDTGDSNAHTKIKVTSKYGDIKIED
ncbi:MAG: hypothetical protein IKZ99_00645 [Salinivirgaceae bacterium]|nr:hypothetical protein [Salinivirgaceae bacterium]